MKPLFSTDDKYAKLYQWLFVIITIVCVALRIHLHFSGRALWEDEAHISLNFMYYGYKELLNPLAHYQVAPVLFLYGVETFTKLFGFSDVALRGFPFIVSLITFPFFYYVSYYITNSRLCAIIAFIIFCFCFTILHYSSEVKPYTLELSAYIGLVYIILSPHEFVKRNRYLLFAIFGSIAMLMANASHIVLACVAVYIVSAWGYRKKVSSDYLTVEVDVLKKSLYAFIGLAIVFLLNYTVFIANHPYAEGMNQIWQSWFIPTSSTGEFVRFMKIVMNETFFNAMLLFTSNWYFPYILLFLYLLALVYAVTRLNKKVFVLILLPLVLHIILSMAEIYPVFQRFYLYLLPALILLLSIGVTYVVKLLQKKLPFAIAIIPALFVIFCTVTPSLQGFSKEGRNIKPGLNFINHKPQDMKLFITTPATLYEYYFRVSKVNNTNTENIKWSISPEEYYNVVGNEKSEYLLLCSTNGYADGYKDIIEDVHNRGLVVEEFTYGSYTILQLKPKQ